MMNPVKASSVNRLDGDGSDPWKMVDMYGRWRKLEAGERLMLIR